MRVDPPLSTAIYTPAATPPTPDDGPEPVPPPRPGDKAGAEDGHDRSGPRGALRFSVGDGRPHVNVSVSIIDEFGRKVHGGHIARIADRTVYAWTPPADAAQGHYSIRWQGTQSEPGQVADLTL